MTTTGLGRQYLLSDDGIAPDSLVLADGSIWSHAATLGTFTKNGAFTIDHALIDSFIRNFRKAPVDYEHSTVSGASRSGQPLPKAGDVVELQGVYGADDFTGDLKTAAERIAAKAGRALSDERNFGLWMRWRPTARALAFIKAGEYSELSIAFDQEYTNSRGEDVGPALLSVALTNLPFLDDMLPVAASRDVHHDRHGTPREDDMSTPAQPNVRLLTAVAAVAGLTTAPETDDQAEKQLTAALPDITRFRAFARDVGTELGEVEAPKAVEKIRALKQEVADFRRQADEAKKAQITLSVSTTIKEHEKKIPNKRMRDLFTRELTRELEAGVALDKTETLATLKELPADGNQRQFSSGDTGESAPDDVKLDTKAKELMESDTEVKALTQRAGFSAGFQLALSKAAASLGITKAPAGASHAESN